MTWHQARIVAKKAYILRECDTMLYHTTLPSFYRILNLSRRGKSTQLIVLEWMSALFMIQTVLFLPAAWPIYCGFFYFILHVSWRPYYFLCIRGCYLVFVSSLKICITYYEPSNVTCRLFSLDNQILRKVYNMSTAPLLGYQAASNGNYLPTFRRLCRNTVKDLPLFAI